MKIYQINAERDEARAEFISYERAKVYGIREASYDLIYEGQLEGLDDVIDVSNTQEIAWALDCIYMSCHILNPHHLKGYNGRRLLTSDVVVLKGTDGQEHAYYFTLNKWEPINFNSSLAGKNVS